MIERETLTQKLSDYLKQNKAAETGEKISVFLKGKYQDLEVYRFPIDMMIFNLENTRFNVQKINDEKINGPIDPSTDNGRNRIINLLLNDESGNITHDSKKLIEDIKQNGQLDPGVISHDGAVINGNRRLACLIHLYQKTSDERFKYFEAGRLPLGTNEKDYFMIEAKLQWANTFKLEYDSMNKYMMLKKAINDHKMSIPEIAKLVNNNEKNIKRWKDELELIEEFLDTTDQPDDFTQISGQTEMFTEAAKKLSEMKSRGEKAAEFVKYKKTIFNYARMNIEKPKTVTYRDIRTLNRAINQVDKRVVSKFVEASKEKKPEKARAALDVCSNKAKEHKHDKKPEKVARDIYDKCRHLQNLSADHDFSKKAEKFIDESIVILKKILES